MITLWIQLHKTRQQRRSSFLHPCGLVHSHRVDDSTIWILLFRPPPPHYVHWQWNTLEWCQLNALQASPVVHLVTPLSCVSLSMNTQPSVPAIDIYVGKICIACLARLSGDGTLVVYFTSLMTSLISTRHPRDVVRVGVWNSLGL